MTQQPCSLPILEINTKQESPDMPISDTYKINIENFTSVLKKVGDYPFAAYCMSGTSRIGKSYTLNFFMRKLGRQDGSQQGDANNLFDSPLEDMFGWRNGRKRETVGINLWSEPFFTTHQGRKVAILFMDGQGLFDNETTFQQNAVIFSLCSLLSSVCIFNVIKKIDAEVLQHLQFFSDYSKAIGSRPNDEDEAAEGGSVKEIQKLIILVRDFDDTNEYDFGYHDKDGTPLNEGGEVDEVPRNYFRDTMLVGDDSKIPIENRTTIKGIRENYSNIGIFLLPDPGKNFRKNPQKYAPDDDYQQSLIELVDLLTSEKHLTTKRVSGSEISAEGFIPYVKHLNFICQHASDHFPSARTIAESTKMMTNTLSVNNAYKVFKESVKQKMELYPDESEEFFESQYNKILEEALGAFSKMKKIGGQLVEDVCRKELVKKCKSTFESLKAMYVLQQQYRSFQEKNRLEQEQYLDRMKLLEAEIKYMQRNKSENQVQLAKYQKEKEILKAREEERSRQMEELEKQSKAAEKEFEQKESWGYLDYARSIGNFMRSLFQ